MVYSRYHAKVKTTIATVLFWIGLTYALCGGCFGGCLSIATSLGDRSVPAGGKPLGPDPVQQRAKMLIVTSLVGLGASVASGVFLMATRRDRDDDH